MSEKLQNHITFKGGAGRPVVFIHGIEDDGSFWYPVDRVVAQFRKVITLDLLGFGKSPQGDALSYSLAEHTEAVGSTIEAELGTGKVTLVAHSLGCYVALEYARKFPERVEKLILSSPVIILGKETVVPRDSFEAVQLFALSKIGTARREVLRQVGNKKGSKEFKALVRSYWPSIKNIETLVEKQNIPGQLAAIGEVPIVVNYGALDPLVVSSCVEHAIKGRANIKGIKYGVGHDVVHAKPAELFSEIAPEVKQKDIPVLIFAKRHRIKLK